MKLRITFNEQQTVETAITEILKNSKEKGFLFIRSQYESFEPLKFKMKKGKLKLLNKQLPILPTHFKDSIVSDMIFSRFDKSTTYNIYYK